MENFKNISIRGRVAYLLSSFEKLLLYHNCEKAEWHGILDKLWTYTSIKFLDDWMYMIAEYMPNSILQDSFDDAEYITQQEFERLKEIYGKSHNDIRIFMQIIYECATCELYSKLYDYSPITLRKIEDAVNILVENGIELVDIQPFKQYVFDEANGWGICFQGAEKHSLFNN